MSPPLDSPSSTSSSPPPFGRKTRNFARRCERRCCIVATYFPLAFVYSLTTWAAYVEAGIGLSSLPSGNTPSWTAKPSSVLGLCLYALLNISYTIAVFTNPGSPASPRGSMRKDRHGYSHLPTTEPSPRPQLAHPITVSSTGAARYCKKCSHPKPDRTHHCSTCRRCVLKMDHHCPWLATCLGLHNYKPFVLFLIYTSLFCWVCFGSTAYWVWSEVLSEDRYSENFMPINVVLLAVISGIIGLVVTGFTSWHLWLCATGMTTIECLEKTRYLRGVRGRVEKQRVEALRHPHSVDEPHGVQERLQRVRDAVLEFHANAVPGATRLEEGEERPSPSATQPAQFIAPRSFHPQPQPETMTAAQSSLARTYASHEADRERARYEDYLADQESSKLPNAFNLGWRRNLLHLFGPRYLLWVLPVTNTTGDGWKWEVSQKWIKAVEEQAERRERDQTGRTLSGTSAAWSAGAGYDGADNNGHQDGEGHGRHRHRSPAATTAGKLGSSSSRPGSPTAMSMQTLKRPGRAFSKRTKQHRRELDYGEGNEVDFFEVSSSNSSSSDDDDDSISSSSKPGPRSRSRRRHRQRDSWHKWN